MRKWGRREATTEGDLLGWPVLAMAALEDGNDLCKYWQEYKKSDADLPFSPVDSGYVSGYVIGVADVYDGIFVSLPETVQLGQICKVVGKYLDERPEELHLPATGLIRKALAKAFPLKPDRIPFKTLEKERPPEL